MPPTSLLVVASTIVVHPPPLRRSSVLISSQNVSECRRKFALPIALSTSALSTAEHMLDDADLQVAAWLKPAVLDPVSNVYSS